MPVSPKTGRLSVTSITSVEDPLLRRHDSARTEASAFQSNRKNNQKIYLKAEDLTIALSGFTTVMFAKVTYLILCIASFGLFYLLLSWLPHWKVRLFGSPRSLRDCTWVVIEVSHSSFAEFLNRPLSLCRTSGESLKFSAYWKNHTVTLYPLCFVQSEKLDI